MERIRVTDINDTNCKKCSNCISYNDGKCDSIDTNYVKVFDHNVCRYHIGINDWLNTFNKKE